MKKRYIFLILVILLISIGLGIYLYIKFGMNASAGGVAGGVVLAESLRRKGKKEELEVDTTNNNLIQSNLIQSNLIQSNLIQSNSVQENSVQEKKKEEKRRGYYAILERDRTTRGPGRLRLYKGDELLGDWGCITGGKEVNPYNYGGLTPTTKWVMVEDIRIREHPSSGRKFKFGRIIPVGCKRDWSKRTFDINRWPFMIHISGSSTGCIAILPDDFSDAVEKLNSVYKEETFEIEVRDK